MSMRPEVDQNRIEGFLLRLGQEHQPGRLFLVGSSALVHKGLRARMVEVDIAIEADDAGTLFDAVRRLKDEMQINVELASPGDFVPLPAGWHERSLWVGRYDALDVFYFDFYASP